MKKRDPLFDIVKGFVMVFVVSGHLAGNGIVSRGDSLISLWFGNFTMAISMPLFFMISGYFAAKTFDVGDVGKIAARIVGFFWPLAAFGVVFGLVLLMCGKIPLWKMVLYPAARVWGGSWFLMTMAIIYAMVATVWKSIKNRKWRLVVIFLMYIGMFFSAGQGKVSSLLRIDSVLHMFPYFIFGAFALKGDGLYKKWFIAIPSGILLLLVVFFEGDVRTNGMAFYWVPVDWQTVVSDYHLFFCFWARTVVGISGSLFVLYVIDRFLTINPRLSRLAVFGTTTLGVYVMHEWPIIQISKYCSVTPLSSYYRWPLALIVFLVCHYVTVAIKNNYILRFFFFSDEKWLSGVFRKWW